MRIKLKVLIKNLKGGIEIQEPRIISGIFPYIRNNTLNHEKFEYFLNEIEESLIKCPERANKVIYYASDQKTARILENYGIYVEKTFEDAPNSIKKDMAFKMKHWMVFNAIKEYGEILWLDWDVYVIKWPDSSFWEFCRKYNTPKFLYIPNYWAVVNCGVYYVSKHSLSLIIESFNKSVDEPNDELLWKSVLPKDIISDHRYWLGSMALNIWEKEDLRNINENTYFLHMKKLKWVKNIKSYCS